VAHYHWSSLFRLKSVCVGCSDVVGLGSSHAAMLCGQVWRKKRWNRMFAVWTGAVPHTTVGGRRYRVARPQRAPALLTPAQEDCARLTLTRFSLAGRTPSRGDRAFSAAGPRTCRRTSDSCFRRLLKMFFVWTVGPQCSVKSPLTAL